jgi:hypothetical protein
VTHIGIERPKIRFRPKTMRNRARKMGAIKKGGNSRLETIRNHQDDDE